MLIAYAFINIAMGLQAFFFPFGSLAGGQPHFMSLAGGVGSGILVLFAVWLSTITPRGGYIMSLFVCAFMVLHFGRGIISDAANPASGGVKFYPKVLSVGLAFGVAGLLGFAHFQARARAKHETLPES